MKLRHLIAAPLLLAAGSAYAGSVTLVGSTFNYGAGFGTEAYVLALQQNGGQDTDEAGGVIRDNGADVLVGTETTKGTTYSVSELAGTGIDAGDVTFLVVFNVNDTGNAPNVDLQQFTVNIYADDAANTASQSLTYSTPVNLAPVTQHPGQGTAGWVFQVTLDSALTSTSRIGISDALVLNVDNGPESFYLAGSQNIDSNPVPLPATATLGLSLLGGYAVKRNRRKA